MGTRPRIPRPTAARRSLYLRDLEVRLEQGEQTVRSRQLGEALGLTDAQVRKDLAHFGHLGHPGIGYPIPELLARLRRLAGTDSGWTAALVGVGNIGRALLSYQRFEAEGFRIVAAFDEDHAKVGGIIGGVRIHDFADLPVVVAREGIRLGLLAVPPRAAQGCADAMVAAGIRGILNFAPRRLSPSPSTIVHEVDLSMSLVHLALSVALADAESASPCLHGILPR